MKKIFTAVLLILATTLHAQEWVRMMEDPEVNFFEVQEAFEEEWGDKGYERGKGYKQFKRWAYFTEPRVYPSGNRFIGDEFWRGALEAQSIPGPEAKNTSPWQPVGPVAWESQSYNPGLGRVNAITVDPNDEEKIYASTPSGGLWVREEGTWRCLTDHLPSIGATGLVIDPTDTDVMYLATGDGDGSDTYTIGVMKSTDGGESWQTTGLSEEIAAGHRIGRIVMNEFDPENIFVAGSNGLYTTYDAGETWIQLLTGGFRDVRLKPGDPEVIYAATGNTFRYSTDGGATFSTPTGLPPSSEVARYAIAVTPANPQIVYLLAGRSSDNGFLGLYRSFNSGQSFTLMSNSPNIMTYSEIGEGEGGQAWYDMALAASPTNENHVYVGGINVWGSMDGGATWEIKSHWVYPSALGYTHADIHSLDFYNGTLYCGSDGGIFRNEGLGNEWEDLSFGLQISQYYRIAASATNPEKLLVGSQDNGTNLFLPDDTYIHLLGGDGNAAAIDYTNDDILYGAFPGGNFVRSFNGGLSFHNFSNSIEETGAWVTPFELHPTDPQIAFAAYENVWKFEDETWTKLGEIPTTTTLRAMEVSPVDPAVIYTSTFSSLFRTVNEGEEWTALHQALPNLTITDIETDPLNPDRVWITYSGYDPDHKVYHSEDGGQTWTNITENLPNLPVNCISYLAGSDDGLYIGTDNGVFYRSNVAPNWSSYNTGLPNVIVNQIIFHYGSQEVIVATYGRGVWKNEFLDASDLQPTAMFSSPDLLRCQGDSIQFSNFSINAVTGVEWFFEGGIPSTTTEFDPTVVYPEPGKYDVRLIAANGELKDTLTLSEYVHIMDQTGVPAPFTENFEEPIETRPWNLDQPADPVRWEQADVGYLSEGSIWVENFLNPPGKSEVFESHTIDLSSMDSAIVTMRVAFATKPNAQGHEQLRFLISTDCGETWTSKKLFISTLHLVTWPATALPYFPQPDADWNLLVINNIQPEERTSGFRMKLELISAGGNNLFIDDINITEEMPVSVQTSADPNYRMELMPNPTAGNQAELVFDLQTAATLNLRVLDANGRTVLSEEKRHFTSGEHREQLDVNHLSPGIYFVELTGEAGRSVKKLVVTTP